MKILLSKGSIAKIALLMLLSLNAFAGMTILVHAPRIKDPTVFIYGSGSVELTWKSGKSETYSSNASANLGGLNTVTFIPTRGWHIANVSIDGVSQEILDEDGFSLTGVKIRNLIEVTFAANAGEDEVEQGSNVESYPTPEVFLIFNNVLTSGSAYAYTYSGVEIYIPPDAQTETWDVTTDAIFDPGVTVILVVSLGSPPWDFDPLDLTLLTAEDEVARADVNLDGVVDGDDVSDVANANPSQEGDLDYDPRLNQNDDNAIDDTDVNIVNNYNGLSVWKDITQQVVIEGNFAYVYGVTDDLSIFLGRPR